MTNPIDLPLRGRRPGVGWVARVTARAGWISLTFHPPQDHPNFHRLRQRALAVTGRESLRALALGILAALDERQES